MPLIKNSQWEQWVFLTGDQHYDSVHCDRELLKRDFDKVKKKNAIILSCGDWFDIMGSMHDPRRSKSELRPEYLKSDYLQAVIEDSADFLKPYAENIGVMIHGNHETAAIKNVERDVTKALVSMVNRENKTEIIGGEYEEFVRMSFVPPKNNKVKETKYSKMFYMYHGSGGASPVTGGVISSHRMAEFIRADFIHTGHTHTSFVDRRTYWEPTNHGTVLEKVQTFIKTSSYKQSRAAGMTTWETVRGIKPKVRGGVWIRFFWDTTSGHLGHEVMLTS